jgi:hypothetical protein
MNLWPTVECFNFLWIKIEVLVDIEAFILQISSVFIVVVLHIDSVKWLGLFFLLLPSITHVCFFTFCFSFLSRMQGIHPSGIRVRAYSYTYGVNERYNPQHPSIGDCNRHPESPKWVPYQ